MTIIRFISASHWRAAWLLVAALISFSVHAEPNSPQVETQRNWETVTKAFAAWKAGGQTFLDNILTPDVVWTIKGSGPSAVVYHGRRDLLERAIKPLSSRLASQIRPTVRDLWAEGEHVVIHWDGETTTRDGQPYRNSYVWIFKMRNGRAVEVTAFLDLVAYDKVVRHGEPAP